ncbi:hypothetical protein [Primorskyibacter sp. S87]|uniref:hypothetical protein n=1 Tax=Primorskyibacter sp. S87 TaxID=3415126 RepID=UPI003C798345
MQQIFEPAPGLGRVTVAAVLLFLTIGQGSLRADTTNQLEEAGANLQLLIPLTAFGIT